MSTTVNSPNAHHQPARQPGTAQDRRLPRSGQFQPDEPSRPNRKDLKMRTLISTLTAIALLLPLVAHAEEGTITSGGVPIRFVDEGQGEAVVLLHSFAGSAHMWEAIGLMPLDGFRTIAFDARGHGESGKPVDTDSYGTQMVADVVALMDERGVEQAHIVGYSMGAETALKLVTEHPDRVLSLIVAGSGWSGEPEAGVYGFVSSALSESDTFGDFMSAMAPVEELTEEEQMAGFMLLQAHGITPDQPAAPLAAVSGAMAELIGLTGEDLGAISVPVLGVTGAEDTERANVERLAEAVPQFELVVIEGADHLVAPTSPDFTDAVTSFLND